jgi:hypothetical protein
MGLVAVSGTEEPVGCQGTEDLLSQHRARATTPARWQQASGIASSLPIVPCTTNHAS